METTRPMEKMQVVGKGSAQLLFETSFDVKPAMSNPIGESYDVAITDYTAFNDRVLIKGTVEKTLYYKHPHGNKGKDSDKKDSDNNEDSNNNDSDSDNGENQPDNTEEVNDDSTASKKFSKFFSNIRKNSRKGKANNQQENDRKSNKNKDQKSQNKDEKSKNNSAKSESEKTDQLKCLSGSGQIVDSAHGIVHFHQQVLQFAGTVEIPGVRPGDSFAVELAEGRSFEPFAAMAAVSEDSNNGNNSNNNDGLINSASHMFVVDVVLAAKRSKAEKFSSRRKKSVAALPLDKNVPPVK